MQWQPLAAQYAFGSHYNTSQQQDTPNKERQSPQGITYAHILCAVVCIRRRLRVPPLLNPQEAQAEQNYARRDLARPPYNIRPPFTQRRCSTCAHINCNRAKTLPGGTLYQPTRRSVKSRWHDMTPAVMLSRYRSHNYKRHTVVWCEGNFGPARGNQAHYVHQDQRYHGNDEAREKQNNACKAQKGNNEPIRAVDVI